jgi:anti-sigma factor (TIGR02949 family)
MKPQQVGLKRPDSPYSEEECQEIIQKLEALLDGELQPEQQQEIVEMVNNCEYCLEQYKLEKSLRQIIKDGFNSLIMNKSLVSSIRDRIRGVRTTPQNGELAN